MLSFQHVDEICIRSSFFNSDVTKLLSINIRDVRVHKLLSAADPEPTANTSDDADKHVPTAQPQMPDATPAPPAGAGAGKRHPFDFRQRKVPPSIMTFAQFIAVHVHHIAVTVASDVHEPHWRMHATVQELHLDGSIVQNAKSLIVTAALNDARAKLLRRLDDGATSTAKTLLDQHEQRQIAAMQSGFSPLKVWPASAGPPLPTETCLVELCFGIALDGVILAHAQPSLEKIQLNMNHTRTTVHDALFDFVRDAKAAKAAASGGGLAGAGQSRTAMSRGMECLTGGHEAETEDGCDDLYARIAPLIPKVSVKHWSVCVYSQSV